MERTLVLLKPDALQRGLTGRIITKLEDRGLKLVGLKLIVMDQNLANQHYEAHIGKPFFTGLSKFMTSSPIIALAVEGLNAIDLVRATVGHTDPQQAAPGTIRGDFGINIGRNLIHASDSGDAAKSELALFFNAEELLDYVKDLDPWITES